MTEWGTVPYVQPAEGKLLEFCAASVQLAHTTKLKGVTEDHKIRVRQISRGNHHVSASVLDLAPHPAELVRVTGNFAATL